VLKMQFGMILSLQGKMAMRSNSRRLRSSNSCRIKQHTNVLFKNHYHLSWLTLSTIMIMTYVGHACLCLRKASKRW
jgi:hypothetical protein